jgi:hypothetical protein
MDLHWEKQTKNWQDVTGTSKQDRSSKALAGHHPPSRHHPSHSSEEKDVHEKFKRHTLVERSSHLALLHSSHLALLHSKKTKQSTINDNREAPVYEGSKQSRDPRFWSPFHLD